MATNLIPRLLKAGKRKILAGTAFILALTAAGDWAVGREASLGAVYILPTMLGALVLRPGEIAVLALLCAFIRSWFDVPGPPVDLVLRFVFALVAYFTSGLFVTYLVKNREQAVAHVSALSLEQARRKEAEEQLRELAESSPAAILTVDGEGSVLAANGAAHRLLMIPESQSLRGRSIGRYLPVVADALRLDAGSLGLRTATQSQGHRDNGEIFLAHMWFSLYSTPEGKRLAAIVVDSSEELRDREELGLRQLLTGNQIATAAIAHEVRNVCEAMSMLCDDLRRRHGLDHDDALRGLDNLTAGLEAIASLELQPKAQDQDMVEAVPLRELLDHLRIVVEPAWREIEGTVRWQVPDEIPSVWAEPHGLLQVFLNVAQNSHRAVQEGVVRELNILVMPKGDKVLVKFHDSGPGVAAPEILFQPFQEGARGSGLGLYVSRFTMRSYGGELRFEAAPVGSCFVVELNAVKDART